MSLRRCLHYELTLRHDRHTYILQPLLCWRYYDIHCCSAIVTLNNTTVTITMPALRRYAPVIVTHYDVTPCCYVTLSHFLRLLLTITTRHHDTAF